MYLCIFALAATVSINYTVFNLYWLQYSMDGNILHSCGRADIFFYLLIREHTTCFFKFFKLLDQQSSCNISSLTNFAGIVGFQTARVLLTQPGHKGNFKNDFSKMHCNRYHTKVSIFGTLHLSFLKNNIN